MGLGALRQIQMAGQVAARFAVPLALQEAGDLLPLGQRHPRRTGQAASRLRHHQPLGGGLQQQRGKARLAQPLFLQPGQIRRKNRPRGQGVFGVHQAENAVARLFGG